MVSLWKFLLKDCAAVTLYSSVLVSSRFLTCFNFLKVFTSRLLLTLDVICCWVYLRLFDKSKEVLKNVCIFLYVSCFCSKLSGLLGGGWSWELWVCVVYLGERMGGLLRFFKYFFLSWVRVLKLLSIVNNESCVLSCNLSSFWLLFFMAKLNRELFRTPFDIWLISGRFGIESYFAEGKVIFL